MHKILTVLLIMVACSITAGCQKKEVESQAATTDSIKLSTIPGMVTHDVSMLISDSGVIRYHVITPVWYTYNLDPKAESYWYFPETIELDEVNRNMQTVGKLRCDTAYHYDRRDLWHLIGHVRVSNVKGEDFKTEDLYWDMRKHTIYSDSFIHIDRSQDILEGYGFTSDEQFTTYEVRQTTGIFAIKNDGEEADYEGEAPDDGEHLSENGEKGTQSPTTDTISAKPMTPQEKAALARERRNGNRMPEKLHF